MTAKKNVNQVMSAKVTSDADAASLLSSADAIVDMTPVAKATKEPTVVADVKSLTQELSKRGGVTMVIKAGTDVLRNVNASNTNINTGGAQTMGQQHVLNIKSLKVTVDLGV